MRLRRLIFFSRTPSVATLYAEAHGRALPIVCIAVKTGGPENQPGGRTRQTGGGHGVYRRISALAAMLQMLATIYDLEQAELRYGLNLARIGRLPKTLDSVVGGR